MEPVLSIICLTYNHEKYVRDALDGFLMQQTSFPIEIIVHDDASTDKTQEIIKEYYSKCPDVIKPILQKENQKSKGNGIVSKITYNAAKGKYIALCEGDDYWTDPHKLQKQVDFLEIHNDYSAIAHQVNVIYSSANKETHLFRDNVPSVITINDIIEARYFHTASIVFRTQVLRNNVDLPQNIISGDRALYILLCSNGKIKFLSDVMGVYRKNEGGISSWVTSDLILKDLNMLEWVKKINANFPYCRFKSYIYYTSITYPGKLKFSTFITNYFKYIYYSFCMFPRNIISVIKITLSIPRIFVTKIFA
ncbi:glycosyltransferase family 2 protein [Saccharicrinis sp. FJH2]|uniref:glycosyltransferase family 2 protein n=1 Tax=Saccharicrinis sp. FJH65 TaxID=3344659 RepID=UPI0035F42229